MEAVKSLQESAEIFDKLRSSYDSLPTDGDRAMFCDIACMLIGMKKEVALTIWKSCEHCNGADCSTSKAPTLVLRRLMDRSLVRVDDKGRLRMHDVLRDMGRDIVERQARGSKKQTHLWDAATALKVLSFKKRNSSIRGIRLAIPESANKHGTWQSMAGSAVLCEVSQLASMEELHLLIMDGCRVVVPDGFSSWPQELRWLQWRYCCFSTLPSHLQLPCLVVLDLSYSDKLTHLWENDAHIQLPQLHTLDLTVCGELEELPENVGQCVPKLRTLVVRGCSKLQQLPEELGTLTNLETLDVSGCRTLSELPASIGGLRMLKTLEVEYTNVRDLPAEVGLLSSLTSLKLHGLCSFPETLHGLQSLTLLRARYESADMGYLGALAALKELDLSYHAAITTLPQTIGNLKWLVRLVMVWCPELSTVEALPKSLEHLDLSDCRKLTRIPSLATMSCLLHLDLQNCRSLRHVHGLECLTALEDIDVSGCTSIEDCRLHGTKNNALRKCDVKGSKVSVAYNNRWLEREPALQVISYLGDAVPVLPNGMANQLVMPPDWTWTLVLRTSIRSKAECVALVWCVATSFPKKNSGSSKCYTQVIVRVWRAGRLVLESRECLAVKGSSDSSQVYLWTMRRGHLAVQSLQLGDEICFLMRAGYDTCTVVEGAVCVVYSEDENLALMVNSEALSQSESQDLALQFGQLVLEHKDEQVNSGLS